MLALQVDYVPPLELTLPALPTVSNFPGSYRLVSHCPTDVTPHLLRLSDRRPSMRKARLPASLISSFPFSFYRSTASVTPSLVPPLRYRPQCLLSPPVSKRSCGFCVGAMLAQPEVSLLRIRYRYPALANRRRPSTSKTRLASSPRCDAPLIPSSSHPFLIQEWGSLTGRCSGISPPASSPTRSLALSDRPDTDERPRCPSFLFRRPQGTSDETPLWYRVS
ncbi:hypothetical protein C8R46DRAFT_1092106 [Mycena filopes]|nr:hypothetical protein C8R46DRAFT_1092106 [Mycena filopes]